jgi:hypothetical protein
MRLGNAFSPNMIVDFPVNVSFREITVPEVVSLLGSSFESVVGHQSTADLFSALLGLQVEANRVSVALSPGEAIVIGQYSGPRLAEGVTALPENATLKWILVEVQ